MSHMGGGQSSWFSNIITRVIRVEGILASFDGKGRLRPDRAPVAIPSTTSLEYDPAVLTDWDSDVDPGTIPQAVDQLAERVDDLEGGAGHAALTLAADAETLLGLTGQQLTLDTQVMNRVFAGPVSGADTDPTFRALVSDDLPSTVIESGDVPGGELGGTYGAPTVNITHSGTSHEEAYDAAVAQAATALSDHEAAADPHAGYRLESIPLYSRRSYGWAPDVGPGVTIVVGDQQGNIWHSGPDGETAYRLYVDCETAPGASGLPVTIQYADTNDLDTVTGWTTIAAVTLSSEKSTLQTSMTNAAIPANRVIRCNFGTIVGTPKDCTVQLDTKAQVTT